MASQSPRASASPTAVAPASTPTSTAIAPSPTVDTASIRIGQVNGVITFSGRTWRVKNPATRFGPGPNHFSNDARNVWVDGNGALHLAITNRDGKWQCAEIWAEEPLGYGRYVFRVAADASRWDPHIVLGLFTWDDSADTEVVANREIDIEYARWGDMAWPWGSYTIQPARAGNGYTFDPGSAGAGGTTSAIEWRSRKIRFSTHAGTATGSLGAELAQWEYTGPDIPKPGDERARLNLWLMSGLAPKNGAGLEVVIPGFEFAAFPEESPWPSVLTGRTGLLVPLYSYPTEATWTRLASLAKAHPTVPVVAIVNPNSGPGSAPDPAYTAGITQLRDAGILPIGYVSTAYAARATASVESDITNFASWYPDLGGIFLDEMKSEPGSEAIYARYSRHARLKGLPYVVANPGTDPAPGYLPVVDTLVLFEDKAAPDLAALAGGWHAGRDRRHFAILRHSAAYLPGKATEAARAAGLVYFTDDILPNPWDTLPGYLDQLFGELR
jgi:hypothetical protein